MLKGIHFLLTYTCNYECDHCFLYCGPKSSGTFQIEQIKRILDEATKIESMEWIYFEGGEPFLYYPILIKGIRMAKERGFKTGIVTNNYCATSVEDAKIWLEPFINLQIDDFSISNDQFHFELMDDNFALNVQKAAKSLGIQVSEIAIDEPTIENHDDRVKQKGKPVIKGGAMLKGRAADLLTENLPKISWKEFTNCPYEDLRNPKRIHIDPFGNIHVCQGISIGNVFKLSLFEIMENYDPFSNKILNALIEGGPAKLADVSKLELEEVYVDECHLCYEARKQLIERFPDILTPKQVYGIFKN
jgi:organic radical activating enzyme